MSHHLIITGTGRAGTTFLVQLFTELGLDTGFAGPDCGLFPNCNAGMEFDLWEPGCPYIVKSPSLCDDLEGLLQSGNIVVDHALIPMRDLYSAAESRRQVASAAVDNPYWAEGGAPGGLWHTRQPEDQEGVLAVQLYKLVHTLTAHDIPTTFLDFPRLAQDPDYLYYKVRFALGGYHFDEFLRAFHVVRKPHLIHDFSSAAQHVAKT
jgi:hypothetical protein